MPNIARTTSSRKHSRKHKSGGHGRIAAATARASQHKGRRK